MRQDRVGYFSEPCPLNLQSPWSCCRLPVRLFALSLRGRIKDRQLYINWLYFLLCSFGGFFWKGGWHLMLLSRVGVIYISRVYIFFLHSLWWVSGLRSKKRSAKTSALVFLHRNLCFIYCQVTIAMLQLLLPASNVGKFIINDKINYIIVQ